MSDKAYLAALHRVDELKRQRDKLREALGDITHAARVEGLQYKGWKNVVDRAADALAATGDEK